MRRRSDLKIYQIMNRFKLKLLALVIILCLPLLVACPPPMKRLDFKVGNHLYFDEILVKTDMSQYKLTGYYFVWSFGDTKVTIKIELAESNSIDENFCEELLSWESNKYMLDQVYISSKHICKYYFSFEHKAFADMSPSQFDDYLENTYLKIMVPMTADDYDEIEIVLDKEKLREQYERAQRYAHKR